MNGKRHPGSMKLIIHRGSKQIGGSCIEVSTAKTRVILDVGAPLEYPAQLLQRSQSQRKRPADLPAVPGLFDDGAKVDGVLLSHAHGDHTGMLEWVNADTPIYLSKGTSKMLLASSIFAGQAKLDRKRQRILDPNTPKQIGDITVTALPVDHSAFDSMALLIEADGKRLLYSGDLRMHGRKPGMAREIFRIAKEKPIDLLLMEGTNLRECLPTRLVLAPGIDLKPDARRRPHKHPRQILVQPAVWPCKTRPFDQHAAARSWREPIRDNLASPEIKYFPTLARFGGWRNRVRVRANWFLPSTTNQSASLWRS